MLWPEFIHLLFSITNRRGKDLSRVREIDQTLGCPHKSYRTIHVGGTNGKGSVSLKIASALHKQGYKVGLYTSPHIVDVRERVQIDFCPISQEDFMRHALPLLAWKDEISFFDIVTLAAFSYFKEKGVDFAVVEVGIGGTYDATNIILPDLAVICSIGMDHTDLLGNTLEMIAQEKGGIVKEGRPLVVGPTAAPFFPQAIQSEPSSFYDIENNHIATEALKLLDVSKEAIEYGLQMRPLCRFQVIPKALSGSVNMILDVAHNPPGFARLIQAIDIYLQPGEELHFIVAFSKDKDWKSCLDMITPIATSITGIKCKKERIEDPKEYQKYKPSVGVCGSIKQALSPTGWNVICGTFYLMEEAIQIKNGE